MDRGIPLAIIVTLLLQSVGAVWAASNLWTRVGQLESAVAEARPTFERVIRLEGKVDALTKSLERIEGLLIIQTK